MAGGGSAGPGEVNSEPNVIPMIDIMLVMLIIFMVSQPLARMALDIQVPPQETAASKPTAASNQIVLELTVDTGISQVMEYFEIFMTRLLASRKAAAFLGATFGLTVNGTRLM